MMNNVQLDPYEQQLLTVFERYDYENLGTLDRDGLTELCRTLQLQEHGDELVERLLVDPKKSRVDFLEFRDALLALLKEMQQSQDGAKEIRPENSPEREVSPRYIYGSKKYGRRSRPKVEKSSEDEQRDEKKRKTFRLKRCDSTDEPYFVCNEDMLRKAWRSLGVGENGYLNRQELILVCDAIGLHNLANGVLRQLSEKIDLDNDRKISFKELLEVLQEDDTWSEMLDSIVNDPAGTNTTPFPDSFQLDSVVKDSPAETLVTETTTFPDLFQYISLGLDGSGCIDSEIVIDMWENVGIANSKDFLHKLGFEGPKIDVTDLAQVLDTNLKSMQETESYVNPHLSLLRANLTLYQSEIRCLKHIREQLNAERDKLKYNLNEADKRATLLAQEVDDNHQKTQESTQRQLRALEQRHNDIVKELTRQFGDDKEELTQLNAALEDRIANLEHEAAKVSGDLDATRAYASGVEAENRQLNARVAELKQVRRALEEQLALLDAECRKYSELERDEIGPLLEKLGRLEIENGRLRDRGDEMGAEIESLNALVAAMRARDPGDADGRALDESMEDDRCPSKRRSDESPSKDLTLYHSNLSSPRLGKVRKVPKNSEDRPTSSESGFSTEIECSECSFCSASHETRLRAKVAFLEQVLHRHDIPLPSDDDDPEKYWPNAHNVLELKKRLSSLERIIKSIKTEFGTVASYEPNVRTMLDKLNHMILEEELLGGKAYEKRDTCDADTATDPTEDFESKAKTLEQRNKELTEKCESLESCIDLLKNEYEKCEDYWSRKLDEERQIYEKEQAQSSEKLDEIVAKMAEYEEQFQQTDRLPPIAETYHLEQQFNDVEEEFENYREETKSLLRDKDAEISMLKKKLTELALVRDKSDAEVQVDTLNEYSIIANKMMNLSKHVVECTNVFSECASEVAQDESNNRASTSSGSEAMLGTPCRPTRTRKRHRDDQLYKRLHSRNGQREDDRTIPVLVSTWQQMEQKRVQLEHRCKHLQHIVKQQQYFAEQTLQKCWQSQQAEKAELQCLLRHTQERLEQQIRAYRELLEKLAKNDLLVKDLFVENSYLLANKQRLEQQRDMLARCNGTNSL